ncbi:hypothetical protein EKL98_02525 [Flavobacterium bomense]|uniref:Uncharacterized protein n=1 Tax=Flavobacterium bomense TaxID=2497483 RepID=A0A3S0PL23_9FLAO|nr:hypothetical protein [Flavobacterium bomense]RTZ08212.1 hypothetical protein EKL98_02525 [Flavobacterium bomense]
MEILFSKESVDVTNELTEKITIDIEKLTSITEDNILLHQKKIFNDYELNALEFDFISSKISMNNTALVPKSLFLSEGRSDNDLNGYITIKLEVSSSGTKGLLFKKPVDFKINHYIKGTFNKGIIEVELPTTIYWGEEEKKENELIPEKKILFNEQKKILKDYLILGKNDINKGIPEENIKLGVTILEILNKRRLKLKKGDDFDDFLNQ